MTWKIEQEIACKIQHCIDDKEWVVMTFDDVLLIKGYAFIGLYLLFENLISVAF